jgi:hypothetical protein
MKVEHNIEDISLTSAEVSQLYMTYIADSMSRCVLSYFEKNADDPDIRYIISYGLELSKKHLEEIKNIFNSVNHPIPKGFGDEDMNLNAKKLFSDQFMAKYMKYLSKYGLCNYGLALSMSARSDVRSFFNGCVDGVQELSNMSDDVLLKKGIYIRSPYIPVPDKIEIIHKKSIMNGFFGDKRPINSLEIAHIYTNILTNTLGEALTLGFSQVVQDKDVKEFIIRGKEIATKNVAIFSEFLNKDNLPVPMVWDADISDSNESPFSDKLMMFQVTTLIAFGIGAYGIAVSNTMRKDISLAYVRLIGEIAQYSSDGLDILIDKGWLERIPEAADRKKLVGV